MIGYSRLGIEPCEDFVMEALEGVENVAAGNVLDSRDHAWIAA